MTKEVDEMLVEKTKLLVSDLLVNIGILPNLNGFHMLKEMAAIMVFGQRQSMTRAYKELSDKTGCTVASVERNIRSAIMQAYKLGQLVKINSLFGLNIMEKNYCLTNSQLVMLLAEFACRKMASSKV